MAEGEEPKQTQTNKRDTSVSEESGLCLKTQTTQLQLTESVMQTSRWITLALMWTKEETTP